MKRKGEGCYSITRAELLTLLRAGHVLWCGKYGPSISDPERRECHPRRDTVLRLIEDGTIVVSDVANATQRNCGMKTYRLAREKTS